MSKPFDAAAHVDHMAEMMGLPIRPEWREMVIAHMTTTAAMAQLLLDFPLDDHVEAAPVFEP